MPDTKPGDNVNDLRDNRHSPRMRAAARRFLDSLMDQGVTVEVRAGRVYLRPVTRLTPDDRLQVRILTPTIRHMHQEAMADSRGPAITSEEVSQ